MLTFKQFCAQNNISNTQTTLFVENVSDLNGLEEFTNLQRLITYNCPAIKEIPTLINLQVLDIDNCPQLKEIPTLNHLQNLYIYNCPQLKGVPTLNNLQRLSIRTCPQIKGIPTLNNLQRLYIRTCPQIKGIPTLNNLQLLYVRTCPQLTEWLNSFEFLSYPNLVINLGKNRIHYNPENKVLKIGCQSHHIDIWKAWYDSKNYSAFEQQNITYSQGEIDLYVSCLENWFKWK